MNHMPSTSERFQLYLDGAGVPSKYSRDISIICAAVLHRHGKEEFSSMMKGYKAMFLNIIQGKTWDDIESLRPYLQKTKRGGNRLMYQVLQEFLVVHGPRTPETVEHVRSFLDLSYTIVPDKVTEDEFHKWNQYVSTPKNYVDQFIWEGINTMLSRFFKTRIKREKIRYDEQFWSFCKVGTRSSKVSPQYSKFTNLMVSKKRSDVSTYDFLDLWTGNPDLHGFWTKYQDKVSPQLLGSNDIDVPQFTGTHSDVPIGTITCIKEQGMKYRWIANPHISMQMVSEPLKRRLSEISNEIPWIYTFDQDMGRFTLAKLMEDHKMISCFDATKFTDTFSRSFQKLVLANMVFEEDKDWSCDLISIFSKQSWQSSVKGNEKVTWESGQPLGTGPSFHLACISHAMVIWISSVISSSGRTLEKFFQDGCHNYSTWDRSSYEFCQANTGCVGDDSFIADQVTASLYSDLIQLLGVEINMSKSIQSDVISEFCGKWVFKGHLIKSSKPHGSYQHYDQILSDVRRYGPHYVWLLPENLVHKFNLLSKVLTPTFAGGCGIQPWDNSPEFNSEDYLMDRSLRSFLGQIGCGPNGDDSISAEQIKKITDLIPRYEDLVQDLYSVYNEYYSRNNPYAKDLASEVGFIYDWRSIHGKCINELTQLPISIGNFRKPEILYRDLNPTYVRVTDFSIWTLRNTSLDQLQPTLSSISYELSQERIKIVGGPPRLYSKFTKQDRFNPFLIGMSQNVYENSKKQANSNPKSKDSCVKARRSKYISTNAKDYKEFSNIRVYNQMVTT